MRDDCLRAQKCAAKYREWGLSPLPSRIDKKAPTLYEFAHHKTEPLGDEHFRKWPTPNIQLMTGVQAYGARKLIVVDCDGETAIKTWEALCDRQGHSPDTWVVTTGSGGRHVYYEAPERTRAVESGVIWGLWDTMGGPEFKGGWAEHSEIRILGDGALAVAPPSIHVTYRDKRYTFASGSPNGACFTKAPAWLLEMQRLSSPTFGDPRRQPPKTQTRANGNGNGFPSRQDVLDSIPDKIAVVEEWGLKLKGGVNPAGWISCHVDATDTNASGSFDVTNGAFQDRRDPSKTLSMFDLGVKLGKFATWKECWDHLSERFG